MQSASKLGPVFVLGNFVQACCWMVPRLPLPGETLAATGVHIEAGGKGLNVAICLQRLGAQVSTLIGCGHDSAGAQLLDLLAQEGVDSRHVHRFEGASGWGSGWIGADGQNAIAVFPGANLQLTAQHASLAQSEIEAASLVYGQFETSMQAVETAFGIAHACGVPTVLNPSPWQPPASALRRTTHTLIVNETEAQHLLGLPSPLAGTVEACVHMVNGPLQALWPQWPMLQRFILTLGAQGSLAWERDHPQQHWHEPALPIDAVDTVGAGDAFASGYCAAMLEGLSLQQAMRRGNACGAHLAAQVGVLAALPRRADLARLLALADSPPDQAKVSPGQGSSLSL